MVWGVVVSAEAWRVVEESVTKRGIDIGWVSYALTDALSLLDEGGIDFLLVEARGDYLTDDLVTRADRAEVGVVALMTSPGSDDLANRRGVTERVRSPRDLEEVGVPAPTELGSPSRDTHPGVLVAVWGPTGAPGRTLIATALAGMLARSGFRTLLVDADQRSGAVAPALGLLDEVPGFVALARLADRGQLTVADLDRLTHPYPVGDATCQVVTGVNVVRHYSEVTPETVDAVMALCRSTFDVVVVDTGSDIADGDAPAHPHEVVATTVLGVADEAVAVCEATTIGVARFARVIETARGVRRGKPLTVVLNAVEASRRSVKDEATLLEALRRFADVTNPMTLPRDVAACRAADIAGHCLTEAAPSSPILKALAPLARAWGEQINARRRRFGQTEDIPPFKQPRIRGNFFGGSRWRDTVIRWRRMLALR